LSKRVANANLVLGGQLPVFGFREGKLAGAVLDVVELGLDFFELFLSRE
jgi:hypothetical protein